MRVAGVVLCGGQSSRMGRPRPGFPSVMRYSSWRLFRRLGKAVTPVVVVAAPGQEVPPLPDGVVVVRNREAGRGPLQGLLTGLEALQRQMRCGLLSSCDIPFLRPAFVERLVELQEDHILCVPHVGGLLHPLAAVYRLEAAEHAARLLRAKSPALSKLTEEVSTRFVSAEELVEVDPELESLQNVNTPRNTRKCPAPVDLEAGRRTLEHVQP